MRVSINQKYKYVTCDNDFEGDDFVAYVMDPIYENHSIIDIPDVDSSKLRYSHFDYIEESDVFVFVPNRYENDPIFEHQPTLLEKIDRLERENGELWYYIAMGGN